MPSRAFIVFDNAPGVGDIAKIRSVLMPSRAFIVFDGLVFCAFGYFVLVLMPSRAFIVFDAIRPQDAASWLWS